MTGDPRLSPPTLLCDADGCLFPSEEPAYDASAEVTAEFLAEVGITRTYSADQLRLEFTGLNFRATAAELCRRHDVGLAPDVLEHWVGREREAVTRHLARVLAPDTAVARPLTELSGSVRLAVVSSSAAARIDTCLDATGLAGLFPAEHRFSAEDLQPPASKPDPAIYLRAVRDLGETAAHTLAVEDSGVGVRAAVAAGVPVLGLLLFVAPAERASRRVELLDAGAVGVVESWHDAADEAARRWGIDRSAQGLSSSGMVSPRRTVSSRAASPASSAR